MVRWILAGLILFAPAARAQPPAPVHRLTSGWLLHLGDDMAWASPTLDDHAWAHVQVPGSWDRVAPGYDGYGWYRLRLRLPDDLVDEPVGLRVGEVGDAFEVYWDGVRIGGGGSLPPNFAEGVPTTRLLVPNSVLRAHPGPDHVLAVRVYNEYAMGGLTGGVTLGRYDALVDDGQIGTMLLGGLIAFFLAIGGYHFVFFLRRRTAKENLYFALLCGAAALYAASFAQDFFSTTSRHVNPLRMGIATLLAAGPIYIALVAKLFQLVPNRISRAASLLLLAGLAVVLAVPLRRVPPVYATFGALVGVGIVASVGWAFLRSRPRDSRTYVLLAGMAGLAIALNLDLLAGSHVLPVLRIIPGVRGVFWLGFLAFVTAVGMETAGSFAAAELNARIDPLTGLMRRNVFEEALAREMDRRRRAGGRVILAILDLDYFKRVNDTYGHRAGDAVLERVGFLLRHNARNIDLVARLGGEEFAALLHDTDAEGAMTFVDRFRRRLKATEIVVPGGVVRDLTVSVGVAVGNGWIPADDLVDSADQAMYAAKRAGRDRLVIVTPGTPTQAAASG
ncbi:MAG TPA: diguanylate cyclase [Longimicrobiaceae bacterium]|nr:diguanylate cyclase [Longimicrobiaceae bacterium]